MWMRPLCALFSLATAAACASPSAPRVRTGDPIPTPEHARSEHPEDDTVNPVAPSEFVKDGFDPISLGPRAYKLLFHRGGLWIQDRSNGIHTPLARLEPTSGSLTASLPGEEILDMHRTLADQLWVLSTRNNQAHLWRRGEDGFVLVFRFPYEGDLRYPLVALSDWKDRPVILTKHTIWTEREDGRLHAVHLGPGLVPAEQGFAPPVAFTILDSGLAYVGLDSGEWGGAFYGVDLFSGTVTAVRRSSYVEGAEDSPLVKPIVALIPDPDHSGCALAGAALRHHGGESGALYRVCGARATELDIPQVARSTPPHHPEPRPLDRGTGVFALASTRRGYWMMTGNALYFVRKGGETRRIPRPHLTRHDTLELGWRPGALFTERDAKAARYWPLLAATSLDGPDDNDLVLAPTLRSLMDAWDDTGAEGEDE